nr:hypothetical protein [Tanacetum cinerariifolium]
MLVFLQLLTTRQVWSLSNPKTSYLTTKVAIVILGSQPSLHYKILRLSQHRKEPVLTRRGQLYNIYCCEVFDSMKVDDAKNVLRWEVGNKWKLVLSDEVENGKTGSDSLPFKSAFKDVIFRKSGSLAIEKPLGDCLVPKGAFTLEYKYCKYGKNGNLSLENGSNQEVSVDVLASEPSYHILSDGMMKCHEDVGVGEFLDLKLVVDWAVDSGFHLLQLLPINDTSVHKMWWDSYPYSTGLHEIAIALFESQQIDTLS